jgi:outer membrane protein assembly factor BamB
MSKHLMLLVGAVLFLVANQAHAESSNWNQFRGPNGTGVADDESPPTELGPEKNVRWKVAAPGGLSSPIIVGDLLIFTAFENDKLYTVAYRRADGSEVWRAHAPAKKLEPFHKTEGSPAASTSASDGERVVSYFGSCGLFCYDLAGKELWRYELPPVSTMADFGTGVSPLLVDGTVVLLRDEMLDPKIIALDAATGNVKWEKKRQSKSGFGTPTVWNTDAGKQIVCPGFGQMIAYDLATGDEVWSIAGMPSSSCTTPVIADDILFYAGWSPGDPNDSDFKMPTFDQLLGGAESGGNKPDTDGDGRLSKAEAQTTMFKDFFDNNDPNKDGFIDRAEWDAMLDYIAASKNSAFAVKSGGHGNITDSHVLWKQTKGLPYVPSAILYRGQYVMVKDGGIVTAYEADSGNSLYQKRAIASGGYYASPVAANGNIYFTSLADGAVTVLKAGTRKPEVVAENPPLGERVGATPAIADDTIYIRTAGHLYAFANDE